LIESLLQCHVLPTDPTAFDTSKSSEGVATLIYVLWLAEVVESMSLFGSKIELRSAHLSILSSPSLGQGPPYN
jgi:hypothetical protein